MSLPEALPRDAHDPGTDPGIDVPQACGRGLAAAMAGQRRQRWLADNREAVDDWNRHVAEHGLPLAAFRGFW